MGLILGVFAGDEYHFAREVLREVLEKWEDATLEHLWARFLEEKERGFVKNG